MELFDRAHGLLFTMTTITPSFFAPERNIEHRSVAKKTGWRSLLISGCVHIFGVILVVILSQLSIDNQKERINVLERSSEIKARLYYPPMPQPQAKENKQIERLNETLNTALKPDVIQSMQATDSKAESLEKDEILQKANAEPETQREPIKTKPNDTPPSPTISNDANRRAGTLNLSIKDGAARYFENYNNNKVAEEAEQASREFQERKNSPRLEGPSTGQMQAVESKRPSKRVNCSGTANRTLAFLSGIAGGTLECTKMGDHDRFIDARVNKTSKNGGGN